MADSSGAIATVVALNHDLQSRQSFVVLVWGGDEPRTISLPVRYGCGLEDVADEANKALAEHLAEVARLTVDGTG